MNNINSSGVGLPDSSALHDMTVESAGGPRVLKEGGKQSLVHEGGELPLQPTAYRSCSPRSRSVGSTTSTCRSFKQQEAKIKLRLARFDLKQKQEEQQEAEQRSRYEAELRSQRAQIEAEEARIKAELSIKESEREVKRAEFESELWESSSVGIGEVHTEGLLQNKACVFSSTSNRPVCDTVNTTSVPLMSAGVYSQPCHSPPIVPVNSPTQMRYIPGIDQRPHKCSPIVTENEATQFRPPNPTRTLEVGDRFLPKPAVEKFDGDPLDYWAFVNRFEVHVASKVYDDDLRLAYVLQHCTKPVYDKVKHIAGNRIKSTAYRMLWQELYERYGQPHIIARHCENRLQQFPKLIANDAEGLEELAVFLKRCLASMEETSMLTAMDSPTFIANIAVKLPVDIKKEWVSYALEHQKENASLIGFRGFAEFVIKQSVKANSVYSKLLFPKSLHKGDTYSLRPKDRNIRAFTSVSSEPKGKGESKGVCYYCRGQHRLEECSEFQALSYKERKLFVRSRRICFKCLTIGHMVNDCLAKNHCANPGCMSQYHHTLLHFDNLSENATSSDATVVSSGHCLHSVLPTCKKVNNLQRPSYLDIVPVRVRANKREFCTYALLDSGANKTFCEKVLFENLEISNPDTVVYSINTLERDEPVTVKTESIPVTILPLHEEEEIQLPQVLVTDAIPASPNRLPETIASEDLDYLEGVDLPKLEGGTVTLLIGNDNVYAHRCLECKFSPDPSKYPDAVRTPLGWLLKGPALVEPSEEVNSSSVFFANVDSFWDAQESDEMLINDKGEVWNCSRSMDIDLLDVEKLMSWISMNKEVAEFGMKYSREDVVAYDFMKRNVKFVNGHYELPLPWRNDSAVLHGSLPNAQRRLQYLKRRFEKSPDLRKKYTDQVETYIQKGYAEKLPENDPGGVRNWYLPHNCVVSPRKPGKVRVVFDCAAKSYVQSLNDHLMKGPNLVNSIVGVLLRFRKHPVAVVADIEAMFHQVRVAPHDRDALRFLWWPGGDLNIEPEVYRMTVHLFGAKSSPSCAAFCLREVANEFGKFFEPNVSRNVKQSFYVDDFLSGARNCEEAIKLVKNMREIMEMGGFNLTKWKSTSAKVMESIPNSCCGKVECGELFGGGNVVLGIRWSLETDEFFFNAETWDLNKPATKRGLIAVINSVYDPLGFLAPVILEARVIYRSACREQTDWDEILSDSIKVKWERWCSSLKDLKDLRIPRYCLDENKPMDLQLHVFSDASSYARGCVCYLRLTRGDEPAGCHLIMAKSLLADEEKRTIPQNELEAATDAVMMARVVKRELGLEECDCKYWTDSTAVLLSLRADRKQFPVFFRNRLTRIQQYTNIHDWMYVPTGLNPADQASRGTSAAALVGAGSWLSGPGFLRKDPRTWPGQLITGGVEANVYQVFDSQVSRADTPPCIVAEAAVDKLLTYFSTLYRLKRAVAWLLRYKCWMRRNISKRKDSAFKPGKLTANELINAEAVLVKYVQAKEYPDWMNYLTGKTTRKVKESSSLWKLSPFLQDGLIKVGGRLGNSPFSYEIKHPTILPQNSSLTSLVINYHHSTKVAHSGVNATLNSVRKLYWVENGRATTRRILKECLFCVRRDAKPAHQLMADLPSARLQSEEPPFSHAGADCFGPFFVKRGRTELKRYGCVFICMTTRAIHLEVLPDLTTDSFINAMRRLFARRGPSTHLYTDNGTNFTGAERVLKEEIKLWNENKIHEYLQQQQIEWKFNTPKASHAGGSWERAIRTVRRVLQAVMPNTRLDDDGLITVFCEVEAVVNSRPLTEVSLEIGEDLPLTPNHLLRLNPKVALSPMITSAKDCYARNRYKVVQFVADEFWRRWLEEYPATIMTRTKWKREKENLRLGDVVLIVDENSVRGDWPLGRVIELCPDKYGLVRSVKVKTKGGCFRRPITKLCPIVRGTT